MLGMKNHFDISDSIEIREVDIAGVACIFNKFNKYNCKKLPLGISIKLTFIDMQIAA